MQWIPCLECIELCTKEGAHFQLHAMDSWLRNNLDETNPNTRLSTPCNGFLQLSPINVVLGLADFQLHVMDSYLHEVWKALNIDSFQLHVMDSIEQY